MHQHNKTKTVDSALVCATRVTIEALEPRRMLSANFGWMPEYDMQAVAPHIVHADTSSAPPMHDDHGMDVDRPVFDANASNDSTLMMPMWRLQPVTVVSVSVISVDGTDVYAIEATTIPAVSHDGVHFNLEHAGVSPGRNDLLDSGAYENPGAPLDWFSSGLMFSTPAPVYTPPPVSVLIERPHITIPEILPPRDLPADPTPAAAPSQSASPNIVRTSTPAESSTANVATSNTVQVARLPVVDHAPLAKPSAIAAAESFIVRSASAGSQMVLAAGTVMNLAAHVLLASISSGQQFGGVVAAPPVMADATTADIGPLTVVGTASPLAVAHMQPAALAQHAASMAKAFFHIAPIDATGLFGDSLAAFARESASIAVPAGQLAHSGRAWVITAGVLAVDAMLLAHWYTKRRRLKAAMMHDGIFRDGQPLSSGF